jgi:hypothetical protein
VLVSPTRATVRQDEVTKLIGQLASLKAVAVIAEGNEASAYGLHDPAITVEFSVAPPAGEESEGAPREPSQTMRLSLAEHEGKVYGMQGDRGPVYELGRSILDQLRAEYRTDELLKFDAKNVQKVSMRSGEESNVFVRSGNSWKLESEPDFPIDSAKVEKVITEALALKTDRYAAYDSSALPQFGLDAARYELQFGFSEGTEPRSVELKVTEKSVVHQAAALTPPADSKQPAAIPSSTAHFAAMSGNDGVFLIPADAIKKVFLTLSELEKK